MPFTVKSYAVPSRAEALVPFDLVRRDVGPTDVRIDIQFCGVCGTDLHFAKDTWGRAVFPVVPGHEIVGVAAEVGRDVRGIKVGDYVAVGCMADSCGECRACADGFEMNCSAGKTSTYNSPEKQLPGKQTAGGYSEQVIVTERFVLKVPAALSASPATLAGTAPLLCAGVTTYVPLRAFGAGKGKHVAILGVGGLGHVAVKLAKAMEATVTAWTKSEDEFGLARALGADFVTTSPGPNSFDLVIDTIPGPHDFNAVLKTLKPFGTQVVIGHIGPITDPGLNSRNLVAGNRRIAGTFIGGLRDTQAVLDFCGEHGITADVELLCMPQINTAWERLERGDVRYRFVIDLRDGISAESLPSTK